MSNYEKSKTGRSNPLPTFSKFLVKKQAQLRAAADRLFYKSTSSVKWRDIMHYKQCITYVLFLEEITLSFKKFKSKDKEEK